jgi:hypothetical protein
MDNTNILRMQMVRRPEFGSQEKVIMLAQAGEPSMFGPFLI